MGLAKDRVGTSMPKFLSRGAATSNRSAESVRRSWARSVSPCSTNSWPGRYFSSAFFMRFYKTLDFSLKGRRVDRRVTDERWFDLFESALDLSNSDMPARYQTFYIGNILHIASFQFR